MADWHAWIEVSDWRSSRHAWIEVLLTVLGLKFQISTVLGSKFQISVWNRSEFQMEISDRCLE